MGCPSPGTSTLRSQYARGGLGASRGCHACGPSSLGRCLGSVGHQCRRVRGSPSSAASAAASTSRAPSCSMRVPPGRCAPPRRRCLRAPVRPPLLPPSTRCARAQSCCGNDGWGGRRVERGASTAARQGIPLLSAGGEVAKPPARGPSRFPPIACSLLDGGLHAVVLRPLGVDVSQVRGPLDRRQRRIVPGVFVGGGGRAGGARWSGGQGQSGSRCKQGRGMLHAVCACQTTLKRHIALATHGLMGCQ